MRGKLKSIEFFASKVFALGEEIKATLGFQLKDRLPALDAGLDAAAQRINNTNVYLEIMNRFQEFARQWTEKEIEAAPVAKKKRRGR
jgi:hypothetical protein